MIEKKKVFWFILLRLLVVTLFLVTTVYLDVHTYDVSGEVAGKVLIRLIGATYLFSLLSLAVLRRASPRTVRTLTYLQIVWDLILVTVLILVSGGVTSHYAFLYFLSIIAASALLARSQAYYTASLCVILYGAILDFQYYGKLAPLGLSPYPAQQWGAEYLFYLIFVHCASFFLTAFLAGHLAERARVSESALKEKAIDYEELERLNSCIVSTIDSGLLTINTSGRIRVFNRYAETLTGVSQQDAYDRPLAEVLPGCAAFAPTFFESGQGEFPHKGPDGKELLLSFKSVPLLDKDGAVAGAIFDLHDLTEMKRMAAELKRADRLAAVGELSARMAHEIRNPLAAISGSVQLVALRPWVDEKDERLFSIILRETDRLDGLLRDFLFYAKPNQPTKVALNLHRVIGDLCALLATDPRLEGVGVDNRLPDDLVVQFDKDQCTQVFWNLLVNAAEAITGDGRICVDGALIKANGGLNEVRISIRDNGSGMSQEDVKRVFEPFFTTKKGGTGLGLATVYRIVETNGGRMSINSALGKGTTITLYLPA
ncbi:PAS domain-containing protein [Geomonas sp. Red69]|uniref:histidine kinase n=1 Tax=Geomonas diazotrophica TaxID=2843197 RepID=A0ABX8JM22_9BACT|nr:MULTISPECIES: ATP-binding protein [Geomonas]MBU5636476.1 PAS domain-containing protein [Geomonas diazotrophica]QWV99021.1 PAS domain-containing protein [Geomonas nitrogeniifigens]QXE88187.1 PAS domain-containing protein [Geomonas nitrogeniifigens]